MSSLWSGSRNTVPGSRQASIDRAQKKKKTVRRSQKEECSGRVGKKPPEQLAQHARHPGTGHLPFMLDIPELDILICQQLSRHDLTQCVQVCRKWSKIIQPHLWRDLSEVSFEQFYNLWMTDYLFSRNRSSRTISDRASDRASDNKNNNNNNNKNNSINNKAAGTEVVEVPLLTKYGHLVQILPRPARLLELLSRAMAERQEWRDLIGLMDPDSSSSDEFSSSHRPCTARRGGAVGTHTPTFAIRGGSSGGGASPATARPGTANRARASRGRGRGRGASRGGKSRGLKAVPSPPFYMGQHVISMERYPNNSRMLVHLLKVRCPNAVKSHNHLTVCHEIVESSAFVLLMKLYVPHARSIVFEDDESRPVSLKLPSVKFILSLCAEPLERLVFNLASK